jgi:methyl acetate hydrolase
LEEALRERVLGPLGMSDAAFRIGEGQRARLASTHARGPDGSLSATVPFEVPQDPEFHMGGGGLYGTAPDHLRFCRMVLDGSEPDGTRILSPGMAAELGRNQIGPLKVRKLETALPASSNDAEFFPGMPKGWSLAFMITEKDAPGGGQSAGSLPLGGPRQHLSLDRPEARLGVRDRDADPALRRPEGGGHLLHAFERSVYAAA